MCMRAKTLTTLKKNCKVLVFKKGQVIFERGQDITESLIVLDGVVKIAIQDKFNKGKGLFMAKSGDLVPTGWVNNSKPKIKAEYRYAAHTDVECAVLNKKMLKKIISEMPEISFDLFAASDERLNFAKHRMEMLIQERAEDKILFLLKYLLERYSIPGTEKNTYTGIVNVLTQQEIADSLGISRESTSICFRNLYKLKIIKFDAAKTMLIHSAKLHKRL